MLVASHVERAAEIKMHLWDSTGGSPQPHLQTWNPRQAERCFGLAPEKLCSVTEITVKQNLHGAGSSARSEFQFTRYWRVSCRHKFDRRTAAVKEHHRLSA